MWTYGIIVSIFLAYFGKFVYFFIFSMLACALTWIVFFVVKVLLFHSILFCLDDCCIVWNVLICVLIIHRPFRQSINMCISLLENSSLINLKTIYIAINLALNMFYKPNSLIVSSIPLNLLYMP